MPLQPLSTGPVLVGFEVIKDELDGSKFALYAKYQAWHNQTLVTVTAVSTQLVEPLPEDFWTTGTGDVQRTAAFAAAGYSIPV